MKTTRANLLAFCLAMAANPCIAAEKEDAMQQQQQHQAKHKARGTAAKRLCQEAAEARELDIRMGEAGRTRCREALSNLREGIIPEEGSLNLAATELALPAHTYAAESMISGLTTPMATILEDAISKQKKYRSEMAARQPNATTKDAGGNDNTK